MTIHKIDELPEAECVNGYPMTQLETLLTPGQLSNLRAVLYGQTNKLCEGRVWDHDAQTYEITCPRPHGPVIAKHDIARALRLRDEPGDDPVDVAARDARS